MKAERALGRLVVALCLAFASEALAQRTTANVYGLVKDPTGAVIPGVTVVLTNEETGVEHALTSNQVGEFSATFLPVGRYTLKINAQGFKSFIQKGLELTAGQQVRYPVTLQVGDISQGVEVTSETPLRRTPARS